MISHALIIIVNELNRHLDDVYGVDGAGMRVGLRNLSQEPVAGSTGPDSKSLEYINLSIVNIKEEKSLKNLPNVKRNDVTLKAAYENPPVFLNFQILVTATHKSYADALLMLSRVIRFFQYKYVFTQDEVSPGALTKNAPSNPIDQLKAFKIIFDLYSPTMEESNHMWGTLGGKQYPFVLYNMRMLDLKFMAVPREGALISEVITELSHKSAVGL